MSKEVILTGLRSNAEFHLGNYLGAILPMVQLQHGLKGQYQLNMFVPDLHSFTTSVDHSKLYAQTINNLKVYVAAGLDINDPDTFVYRQSYIPAHSELTWILSCFTYFGELSRMTQFKEKSATEDLLSRLRKFYGSPQNTPSYKKSNEFLLSIKERVSKASTAEDFGKLLVESINALKDEINYTNDFIETLHIDSRQSLKISAGLFDYPVLMAADILLYGAKWVPVGEDQRQHLELTRDLAIRINNKFGEIFTVPNEWSKQLEFIGIDKGTRIRSLKNPDKKMSKSVDDPSGTIMLSDNLDEAKRKIMSATTDSVELIAYDWDKQPGITNLLQILALSTSKSQDDVNNEWTGKSSYGDLKLVVADAVTALLSGVQSKLGNIDDAQILDKLEADEKTMQTVANATLTKAQKAVGLRK